MAVLQQRIKQLRNENGLTQAEMAELLRKNYDLKTDRVMISKWETGFQTPEIYTISCIADLFNVSIDYLNGKDTKIDYEKFGKRLKELREKHNYSMDKFVELYNQRYDAKMNKSTLSRYENGLQDPIYTVVVNMADFFGVSVDYLSGGTNKELDSPDLSKEEFALWGEIHDLTEAEKKDIMEYIKFKKNQRKNQ